MALMILFVVIGVLSLIGAVAYHFLQQRPSSETSRTTQPNVSSLVGGGSLEPPVKGDDGDNSKGDGNQHKAQNPVEEPSTTDVLKSPPSEIEPPMDFSEPAPDASSSPREGNDGPDFVFRDRRRRPPTRQKAAENPREEIPHESEESGATLERGSLNLLAVPQSDVYWRGRKIGRTPLFEYSMPAGRHSLELRAVNGDSRQTVSVAIAGGGTTRRTVRY
jgi:hypothetical protein